MSTENEQQAKPVQLTEDDVAFLLSILRDPCADPANHNPAIDRRVARPDRAIGSHSAISRKEKGQPMLSVEVAYKGSAADKELAGKMFQALGITGRFMSFDAPISMPIADLVELLGKLGTQTAEAAIQTAAKKNDAVFRIETGDEGVVSIATTRAGKAPAAVVGRHEPLVREAVHDPATQAREAGLCRTATDCHRADLGDRRDHDRGR